MHGNHLLIAGPLIATLVFAPIGTSQASAVPAPASAGESRAAPPVCKKMHPEEGKICRDGYADGFEAGSKCGQPLQRGRYNEDEAYDIGYAAGFKAGKRTCPS
ncbi:hypothetical protein [Nonomuraea sp. SBT364]|uniref:hypothetical protein n=1 Tax=Nonomuraea sp. SBT364 TaxID=1580530 RepID=UPI00066AB034|nr:hypothetical protein [Nonomuraea sp. SBT364]